MLNNPYQDINWETIIRVQGNTHNHLVLQHEVDNAVRHGMEHLGMHSHYGKPLYPASDFRNIVLPDNILEYPLAEHYGTVDMPHPNHFTAVGSTLITDDYAPHSGFDGTWKEFMDAIRDTLLFPDGGGMVVVHPGTQAVPDPSLLATYKAMYDYDPELFLGIEFFNDSGGKTYAGRSAYHIAYWDALLASGRQVWGHANPDYEARMFYEPDGDWRGKSVILVSNRTSHDCLKAYRKGHFYCALHRIGFEYTNISTSNMTVSVSTNQVADKIKFKTATREVDVFNVDNADFIAVESDVYIRIEAYLGDEILYSQPIMTGKIPEEPDIPDVKEGKSLVHNRAILI